jgi:hypothetical protein
MAPSRLATPPPSTTASSLKGESVPRYGDFRDDFYRDGYASISSPDDQKGREPALHSVVVLEQYLALLICTFFVKSTNKLVQICRGSF